MSISLQKGQRIDLTKSNPGLETLIVGLGWDVQSSGGRSFDLDASVFLLDENDKYHNKKDLVCYYNLKNKNGSVRHLGDNLTGAGDGDDEQIVIKLKDVEDNIKKIVVVANIYQARSRNQTFGQVNNAFIRLVNEKNNTELMRYNLGNDFSKETAIIFGELYRHNGEWKFSATGSGYQGGLDELESLYKG